MNQYCKNCGTPMAIGTKYCPSCGTPTVEPSTVTTPVSNYNPTPTASASIISSNTTPVNPANTPNPVAPASPAPNKKPFWRSPVAIAIAASACILIAVVTILVFALKKPVKTSGTRTTMIYMIGSNLESENAAATMDLEEIISSNFDQSTNSVYIYTGGTKKWHTNGISPDENAIYQVANGQLNKLESYQTSSMTAPASLTSFIDYITKTSSSDLYDLILWDHGGGPIFGYGIDENTLSQQPMSLTDLAKSLADSQYIKSGNIFDYIGFDACLMGSIEVAHTVQPYAHYLVSSEEVEPGYGWDYSYLAKSNDTITTPELATSIIDSYSNFYSNNYRYATDYSLSAIDLTELNKVIDSASKLFSSINTDITASTFANYSKAMTRNTVYGAASRDGDSYDLVDLVDLASSVSDRYPNEFSSLKNSINSAIIYSRTNIDDTNGLSIYFPTKNKQYFEELISRYKLVTYSPDYYNFLLRYGGFFSDNNIATRTTAADFSSSINQQGIVIDLPENLSESYQSAGFNILRKLGDNHYMPVYQSSDITRDGNKLLIGSGSTALQFAAFDNENKPYYMMGVEVKRTPDYADYYTTTVSEVVDEDSYFGFSDRNLQIYFRINKDNPVAEIKEIKDVTKISDDDANEDVNNMSAKASVSLDDILTLRFYNGDFKFYDDNGSLLEGGPASWGTAIMSVFNMSKDNFRIELKDLNFDYGDIETKGADGTTIISNETSKDFYCQVIVTDVQGEKHRMNLVHINNN